jgi:hypothetical protein
MDPPMPHIFISYSRQDAAFAKQLTADLENLGCDIFLDVDDIPAGKRWSDAIQEGLDSAELMLVIVSPPAMTSPNVADEWHYFLDHNKPVIPVRLEPAKLPFQRHRLQYVDFHEQDYKLGMRKLIAEMRRIGITMPRLDAKRVTQSVSPFVEVQPARPVLTAADLRAAPEASRVKNFVREELSALNKALIASFFGVVLACLLFGGYVAFFS